LIPTSQLPSYGYIDRASFVTPTNTTLYLANKLKLADDKVTFDLGARYGSQKFGLYKYQSYTDSYVDPRAGLNYTPNKDLVFRAAFGANSQFPDTHDVEILFPEDYGQVSAASGSAQLARLQGRYAQFNKLGTEHSNNYELGVEKAFNYKGGSWAANLTTFQRYQYDLIQYARTSYNPLGGLRSFDNSGHGRASGVEFILSKKKVNDSDLNGFFSYTNQVAKATNSAFDTGYLPYFYNAFAGDPNISDGDFRKFDLQEYPTTYDQRHTVAIVANKKLNKWFETSFILDAGSGYPFVNGLANVGEGADAQHSEQGIGSADFTQVPITGLDKTSLQPLNPVAGRSGWHYKVSINSNFYLSKLTNLFLNVDNVFDKKTVLAYSTTTQAGQSYYDPPSAQYPQGRIYYGNSTIITPIFLSFGVHTKF
jgi:outer membrane receptor protein involved in Fe transport